MKTRKCFYFAFLFLIKKLFTIIRDEMSGNQARQNQVERNVSRVVMSSTGVLGCSTILGQSLKSPTITNRSISIGSPFSPCPARLCITLPGVSCPHAKDCNLSELASSIVPGPCSSRRLRRLSPGKQGKARSASLCPSCSPVHSSP